MTLRLASDAWSRARLVPEADDHDPYATDRRRILATSAFRRLAGKTQVFILPSNDHYRTRLTHTLDVADIARQIARGAGCDEDLTEAIALGHDLGHTPFGHAGEQGLDRFCREHLGRGFRHREQSLRLVSEVARLNLTQAVRDGILHHSDPKEPSTREGMIVRVSDRIAYLTHDVDDAVSAGVISAADLPAGPLRVLGASPQERRELIVADMVETAGTTGQIRMSDATWDAFIALREFMFERVYLASPCIDAADRAGEVVYALACHFHRHPELLPDDGDVVDYVAGMTDRFAVATYTDIHIPVPAE